MSTHADSHSQPAPTGDGQPVTVEVIRDIVQRRAQGMAKYGVELKTDNDRDALTDLYQELLDATMYTKQALMERDAQRLAEAAEGDIVFLNPEVVAYALHFVIAYRASLGGSGIPRPLIHRRVVERQTSIADLQAEYAKVYSILDQMEQQK